MFDSLSTRLQDVFKTLRGEARLTPENIEAALREIRLALLEADVNFKVVKAFIDRVRDRAMDAAKDNDILRGLPPSQQVVRIVRDEMVGLFGNAEGGLQASSKRPRVILLLGLQGAGKTTTAGKLATWLKRQGKHPLLVSTDVKRPAAIQQLNVVAQKAGARVHDPAGLMDPVARAKGAVAEATSLGFDAVIVDTAGRLHIDDELMTELVAIKETTDPSDRLFVADAMTGQDAIKSAGEFNARVGVTGVVLTKLDGDARGGAALSVVSVVGVPIAFAGSGERLEDLEPFTPNGSSRACSAWATCCRSSRRPKRRSRRKTPSGWKRRSDRTSSPSRISAIS
jgi:signal recognition particle subunit SRP54